MTREEHQRMMQVLADAMDRPASERANYLDQSCQDETLRAKVEELLAQQESADDFLEEPLVDSSAVRQGDEAESAIGQTLGPYRLTEEIGRGGMGAVYLGVRSDDEFERRVAIKVIKRGMDTDAIQRRFRRERQILANLDHPYIGRLFDGGTTADGRPYLVMEHIEGVRIDRYAEQHGLDRESRIKLILKVCDAVQHAHDHHVVHGDIKPANILVTVNGTPKLLDFGIARIIKPRTGSTESSTSTLRVMTPQYASPEQKRGEPITPASDVYSLGAVLHDLFAVRADRHAVDGRRGGVLKGDLDKIVAMSLREEPERRYASVSALADDLARYLDGHPVHARKDTIAYRVKSFFRRHDRSVIATGAVAVLCLVLGVLFARSQAVAQDSSPSSKEVGALSRPAQRYVRSTEAYRQYMMGQYFWNKRSAESMQKAIGYFDRAIAADPGYAPAYAGTADAWGLLGAYFASPTEVAFPRAKKAALDALALDESLPEAHTALALTVWLYDWDWDRAEKEFRRAIELDAGYPRAHHWFALFLGEMGRSDESIAEMKRALDLDPASLPIYADLGRVYYWARRYDDALAQYQKAIEMGPTFSTIWAEMRNVYEQKHMYKEWFASMSPQDLGDAPRDWIGFARSAAEGSPGPHDRAENYARIGRVNESLENLQIAIAIRDHRVTQLKVNPILDPLRSDSRFRELLNQMNLAK